MSRNTQSPERVSTRKGKVTDCSNKYAISIDGLGESLTRSAAALKAANNDLAQAAAMTIAANNVTQDPLVVGNSLKTVSMRIRGTKIDEDEDGDTVMEAGALRKLIYDATKVDIVDENNQFKSTYEILLEISKVWKTLDDMTRATLLEKIAGKHRASSVSALLNDTETLVSAYEDALTSVGSAEEEFLKRTESVEFHLKQLNSAWQNLASNAATVETVNKIIDGLTTVVDIADWAGVGNIFMTLATAVGGLFAKFKAMPYFEAVKKQADANGESIKLFGKELKDLDGTLGRIAKNEKTKDAFGGLVKTITGVGKALKFASAGLIAFFVATKVSDVVGEAISKFLHRVEDTEEEINSLTSGIDKLKSELLLLKNKADLGSLTFAEKERLSVLKEEIELQEYDLQLARERWKKYKQADYAPTVTTTNGEVVENKGTPADYTSAQIENQSRLYFEASRNIKKYYTEIAKLTKAYDEAVAAGENTGYINNQMRAASDNLRYVQQQQQNATEALRQAYVDLGEQQADLTRLVEWSIGPDKEAYQAKLDMITADYELTGAMLGIKKVDEKIGQGQLDQIAKYEELQKKISAVTSEQGLSVDKLNELKSEYPEVARVIETYGQKSGDVWQIESSWMSALQTTANDAFDSVMAGQVQTTLVSQAESDKRIAKLQEEIAWWTTVQQRFGEDSLIGKFAGWRIGTKNTELSEEQEEAERIANSVQKVKDLLNGLGDYNEDDDPLGDLDGKGLGDGDGDAADVFDKYANALANAREEVESYSHAVELAQAQLDLNQSQEERTVDLLTQEQELYNTLLEAQQAQYKITNDTLWLQQQQLKTVQEQAKEKIQAVAPNYDVSDIESWTAADVEKFIELHLTIDGDDAKAVDKDLANYLNSMVDMKDGVHELYVEWYNLKQELRETRKEELQSILDWQKDSLEQFDDARKQTEMLLDLLGEVEDTEQQRMNLAEGLAESYESQKDSIVSMHEANARKMNELAGDLENNQELYQMLVKQNEELEENYLSALQSQLSYKQQLLELEQEYAEQMAETEIYGEQGQDRWEDARQDEIDALNDQIDSLRKKAEEDDYAEQMAEYEEELAEKQEEIAELYKKLDNLRAQKTVQTLEQQEDGSWQWKYIADEIAINETLEEIADKEVEIEEVKNEMKEAEEERALEEEIEHLESQIEAIEDEVQRRQELFDQELEIIEQTYQREKAQLSKWLQDEIANWQARITASEQNLAIYDQVNQEGWQTATENTNTALTELSQVYTDQFNYIMGVIKNYESTAMAAVARIHAAIAAAKRAAAEAESEASGGSGSHANGLKFVEANNYIARLHYGERVLTRQEARQYNELEDDIKSGKLAAYFESAKVDAMNSISSSVSQSIGRVGGSAMPMTNTTSTSFVIEHLELPNVQDSQDFAAVLQSWARNEFGGLAQKAKIVKAR